MAAPVGDGEYVQASRDAQRQRVAARGDCECPDEAAVGRVQARGCRGIARDFNAAPRESDGRYDFHRGGGVFPRD